MFIGYNIYRLIIGLPINVAAFIISMVLTGMLVSIVAFVNFFNEERGKSLYGYGDKNKLIRDMEREQEEFMQRFKKTKEQRVKNNDVNAEPFDDYDDINDIDEFAGDAVYDNLGNIFGHVRESFGSRSMNDASMDYDGVRNGRIIIDAEINEVHPIEDLSSLTVAELRDICRDNGIKGYSSMKKAELLKAIENL